jgi:hypothetical protein
VVPTDTWVPARHQWLHEFLDQAGYTCYAPLIMPRNGLLGLELEAQQPQVACAKAARIHIASVLHSAHAEWHSIVGQHDAATLQMARLVAAKLETLSIARSVRNPRSSSKALPGRAGRVLSAFQVQEIWLPVHTKPDCDRLLGQWACDSNVKSNSQGEEQLPQFQEQTCAKALRGRTVGRQRLRPNAVLVL